AVAGPGVLGQANGQNAPHGHGYGALMVGQGQGHGDLGLSRRGPRPLRGGRRRSRAASSMPPAAPTRPSAPTLTRLGRSRSGRGSFADSARRFVAWTDAQVLNRIGRALDAVRRWLIAVRESERAGSAHRQLLEATQPGDEARRAGRAAEAARLERV